MRQSPFAGETEDPGSPGARRGHAARAWPPLLEGVTLRSRPARISIALALLLVAQFRAAAQLNDSQHVKLTVGAPAQVRTGEQFEVSVKLASTPPTLDWT